MKKFWEANYIIIEGVLAFVIALGFVIWAFFINHNACLSVLLKNNRKEIYGALSTIFGSLLGFIITTVSIIIGYSESPRLEIVTKSKHYGDLWNTFISTIKVLALATIFALLGLIFDRNSNPVWVFFYINFFFSILTILRIGRCIWIFEKILQILIRKIPNQF